MVCRTLYDIKTRTKMQVDTFILLFFCFRFDVSVMIFIYMVIVKEIVFTCVIYVTNLDHQIKCDVPHFCVTLVLLRCGKGYTHMFSCDWLDSNAYFPCLRNIIHLFVLDNPV